MATPTTPVIAASTLAYTQQSLDRALARLVGHGFTTVELPARGDGVWPGHIDPQALAEDTSVGAQLSASLQAAGVQLASVGVEHAADLPLAREYQRVRALAAWMAEQGAQHLTVFAYPADHAAERWRELRAIASDHGLSIGVETHLGTATANPADAIALAEALDLTITLDASHYVGQGYQPDDWHALEARVRAVQVRHCQAGELQQPISAVDNGSADQLAASLARLIPDGYSGTIVCEQIDHPGGPDWGPQLVATHQALKRLFEARSLVNQR